MRTYLSALLGVCIVSAIIRVLSPLSVLKKYIEMLSAICIISVVVLPICQGITEDYRFNDAPFTDDKYNSYDYGEIYNNYLSQKNVEMACCTLENELARHVGVSTEEIDVNLTGNEIDGVYVLERITVTLGMGAVSVDPDTVIDFISERTGIECEIIYDDLSKNIK